MFPILSTSFPLFQLRGLYPSALNMSEHQICWLIFLKIRMPGPCSDQWSQNIGCGYILKARVIAHSISWLYSARPFLFPSHQVPFLSFLSVNVPHYLQNIASNTSFQWMFHDLLPVYMVPSLFPCIIVPFEFIDKWNLYKFSSSICFVSQISAESYCGRRLDVLCALFNCWHYYRCRPLPPSLSAPPSPTISLPWLSTHCCLCTWALHICSLATVDAEQMAVANRFTSGKLTSSSSLCWC